MIRPPTIMLTRRALLRRTLAVAACAVALGPQLSTEAIAARQEAPVSPPAGATSGSAASTLTNRPDFVKPREAWQAAPPAQPYVPHIPRSVILHHVGVPYYGRPPVDQYLRNMQAFHVGPEREWEDIAYHFLVDSEGGVWAGRPPDVRGNPSVYYDAMGLVLICFLGDFDQQQPTEPQLVAAAKIAGWIIWRYGLPPQPQTMLSHCDRAPTACPGQSILQVMHDGSFVTRVLESLPRRA